MLYQMYRQPSEMDDLRRRKAQMMAELKAAFDANGQGSDASVIRGIGWVVRNAKSYDIRVLAGELLRDLYSAVGGAVIDDQDPPPAGK